MNNKPKTYFYYPVTPAGTLCDWLQAKTEKEAWDLLLEDAKHMPYKGKEGFRKRGYTVEKLLVSSD